MEAPLTLQRLGFGARLLLAVGGVPLPVRLPRGGA